MADEHVQQLTPGGDCEGNCSISSVCPFLHSRKPPTFIALVKQTPNLDQGYATPVQIQLSGQHYKFVVVTTRFFG